MKQQGATIKAEIMACKSKVGFHYLAAMSHIKMKAGILKMHGSCNVGL